MSGFTIAWLAMGAYFLVVEGIALFNKEEGDTLSEHVWRWFATGRADRNPTAWVRARRFALLAFMAWLSIHFLTGGVF